MWGDKYFGIRCGLTEKKNMGKKVNIVIMAKFYVARQDKNFMILKFLFPETKYIFCPKYTSIAMLMNIWRK